MSLIQHLQQTLLKNVSHNLLEQIQMEHSAAEQLLDQLASLHQIDKFSAIQQKIRIAKCYMQIKQSIYQSLYGISNQAFHQWVSQHFEKNKLAIQLIKQQKIKMQAVIIKCLREVFILQKQGNQDQQQMLLNYIQKLTHLKENQERKQRVSRQQIVDISHLDLRFLAFKQKFQQKIDKFNYLIQEYTESIKVHQQQIRRVFRNFFDDYKIADNTDSPFKQLNSKNQIYQPQHEIYDKHPKFEQQKYMPNQSQARTYKYYAATRDYPL